MPRLFHIQLSPQNKALDIYTLLTTCAFCVSKTIMPLTIWGFEHWVSCTEHLVNDKASYCGWEYFVFTAIKMSIPTRILF